MRAVGYRPLAASMSVPDELALMDQANATSFANYFAYQPFFEASREKQFLETVVEKLRLQMVAQELESKIAKH
jgi:hypothetical protein